MAHRSNKLLLISSIMILTVFSHAAELETGQVHYLEDLTLTFEQLLKQTPFVIVDLYAQWCGPCKSMSSVLEKIAQKNPDILILKVDIEQFDAIRVKYNVKSIPTLLLFKDGAKLSQEVGFLSEQAIQMLIDQKLQYKNL